MIATLLAGLTAKPWARTALRYGAIALAVLLFLLALRRSGERAGRMFDEEATLRPATGDPAGAAT